MRLGCIPEQSSTECGDRDCYREYGGGHLKAMPDDGRRAAVDDVPKVLPRRIPMVRRRRFGVVLPGIFAVAQSNNGTQNFEHLSSTRLDLVAERLIDNTVDRHVIGQVT